MKKNIFTRSLLICVYFCSLLCWAKTALAENTNNNKLNKPGAEGVDPYNGALTLHKTDISVQGRNGAVPVTRFYINKRIWRNSTYTNYPHDYSTPVHLTSSGMFGAGWDLHFGKIYTHVEDETDYHYKMPYENQYGNTTYLDSVGEYDSYVYKTSDGSYTRYSWQWQTTGDCIMRNRNGGKTFFTDTGWRPITYDQIEVGHLAEKIIDKNGNFTQIYYGNYYDGYILTIDSISTSSGLSGYFFYSRKPYFHGLDSVALVDSVRTKGYLGNYTTVKYHYKLLKTTVQPLVCENYGYVSDEENGAKVALTDTLRRYCLTSVIYPNGDSTIYDYNQYFELIRETQPTGSKIEYSYTDISRDIATRAVDTTKVLDENNTLVSKTIYHRDFDYNTTTITDSKGNDILMEYDGQTGTIINERRYSGSYSNEIQIDRVMYSYTSDSTGYQYGKNMRMDSVVNFIGDKKFCTKYRQYDGYGNFRRVDHMGDMSTSADNYSVFTDYLHSSKTQYNFDNANILELACSTYVKPDSASTLVLTKTKFFYDDTTRTDTTSYSSYPPENWQSPGMIRGNLTRACRWKAGALYDTTQMFYDKLGHVIKTVNAKGDSSKVFYTALGSYSPDKFQYAWPCSTVGYVANGANVLALSSVTDYDSCTGLVLWTAGANCDTTRFEYDSYGRPTKVAKPGEWAGSWGSTYPSVITHYYDAGSTRSTMDSAKITGTKYAVSKKFYNSLGRVIQVQKQEMNGTATIVNTAYDSLGQVQKTTNPIATNTTFGTYDNTDYWTSQPKVQYYYDAIGRIIKTVNQDSTRDSVAYGDNWVKTWDAKGDTTISKTNGGGMADTTVNGLGLLTIVKYDKLHRDSVIIDAAGKTSYCYYDTLGRSKGSNGPDASSSYTYNGSALDFWLGYDAADNVTCRKNAKGVVNYTYDALNRVSKVDSAGSDRVLYKYDSYADCNYTPADTMYARGRVTRLITAGIDTTWFTYDKAGRLTKRIFAYAGMSGGRDSIHYAYNSAGACTALTYPDGTVIKYSYNTLGQMMSVRNASQYYVDTTYYNVTNLAKKIQYSNYTNDSMFYDSRLRINRLKTTNYVWEIPATYSRMDLSYSYWEDGYIKKVEDNLNSAYTQYYDSSISYDAAGRLKVCKVGSTVISYTYDNVGNRTAEVKAGTSRSLTYTSGTNKLATANISGTTYTYSHDNAGNITQKTWGGDFASSFYYDYNSMLVKVYNDALGRTVTNYYGGGGTLKIKKKDSQLGSRYYAYEGINPLCEYDSTGSIKKKYIYAFGYCIAYVDSSGANYWMHHDVQGSVKVITNSNGDSVASYKYYPFGDSLLTRGSAKNEVQFTGKQNIAGAELYDFSARYYDPEIGRFYSRDPMGSAAASPYAYCNNNPINLVDPTGMVASNPYPPGWYNVFGSRFKAKDAWQSLQALADLTGELAPNFGLFSGSMAKWLEAHPDFYAQVRRDAINSHNMFKAARYNAEQNAKNGSKNEDGTNKKQIFWNVVSQSYEWGYPGMVWHGNWGGNSWTAGQHKNAADATAADRKVGFTDKRDYDYKIHHDLKIADNGGEQTPEIDLELGRSLFFSSPFQVSSWVTTNGAPVPVYLESAFWVVKAFIGWISPF